MFHGERVAYVGRIQVRLAFPKLLLGEAALVFAQRLMSQPGPDFLAFQLDRGS
jgi:hypothetical protein